MKRKRKEGREGGGGDGDASDGQRRAARATAVLHRPQEKNKERGGEKKRREGKVAKKLEGLELAARVAG